MGADTVTRYNPNTYEKIIRSIKKVFRNKPAGNVGVGGYSTPITNVIPEKFVSGSAKSQIAQRERISNLTSGGGRYLRGGSGGGSSGGSSGGGSSGITQAQIQAEQKRQAEIKRQQEEAKRLADQLKVEKQKKATSQTISGQIDIKDNKVSRESFGTIQNYGVKELPSGTQIYTQPTIEKRTTGSFKDIDTGKNIPTTSYFLIEPPKGAGVVKETKIKPSTITPSGVVLGIKDYEDITVGKEEVISSEKRTLTKKVTSSIGGAKGSKDKKMRSKKGYYKSTPKTLPF